MATPLQAEGLQGRLCFFLMGRLSCGWPTGCARLRRTAVGLRNRVKGFPWCGCALWHELERLDVELVLPREFLVDFAANANLGGGVDVHGAEDFFIDFSGQ